MPDQSRNQAVGTELLFENGVVRVWRMFLRPGESCAPHMHANDHVLVYANPSLMEAREAGRDGVIRQPSDEGFVLYREVGAEGCQPITGSPTSAPKTALTTSSSCWARAVRKRLSARAQCTTHPGHETDW